MARWGIGDLEDELARVRALRAQPVGKAADDLDRREVFGASLEQFEQLLRSAVASPPTTSPLPLFYALSQSGRAIAAAHHPDPARWNFHGHGLKSPQDSYPEPIGCTELEVLSGGKGAFRVVSEAIGSPLEAERLVLAELWASLPNLSLADGLGAGLPAPQHLSERLTGSWTIEVPTPDGSDLFEFVTELYPDLDSEYLTLVVDDADTGKVNIFPRRSGKGAADLGEPYLGDRGSYLRPRADGGRPPSIFMTWWAVLFALSQLVRYEPATWAKTVDPDRSALTVPVEDGLRRIEGAMPKLVAHALTRRWS